MRGLSTVRTRIQSFRLGQWVGPWVGLTAIAALLTAGLFVIGAAATGRGVVVQGAPKNPGDERYVAHLSTDKPIYRVGEKIYIRSVLLGADGHAPISGNATQTLPVYFEIKGPKGDIMSAGAAAVVDSVAGFTWTIPAGQAGGEYTIQASHPSSARATERKFDIRTYRAPRLKTQIVFVRDGYGPGDAVSATLHVERAEGGVPAGARVSVTARVDGEEVWAGAAIVDASGNAAASFKLPAAIARGEGALAMTVEDGGVVETAVKSIPILLQTLDIAIYPEGGDLIAGLSNRVYVEGRTPSKKPADIAAVIEDSSGVEVARFRTEHDGRGRFSFVPVKGRKYALRVLEPSGIKKVFGLPAVKNDGVVLSATSDVTARRQNINVRVSATNDGTYGVALSRRGREIAYTDVALRSGRIVDVSFDAARSLDGVVAVAVYKDNNPLAERLLFRQPEHQVNVKVTADRADYVPSEKVSLRVTTTDELGKPLSAVVGLTVTDSSVLEMIDKREQSPRLPVMVLLEHEVKDLADAHVYLDEANPKAPLAIDLLLGTQGWRRFAYAGTGALSGVVSDAFNAVIPGVAVQAANLTTGFIQTAVTDERGAYVFSKVAAGDYRVSAALPGFQTVVRNLGIQGNKPLRQDFRLDVAMMMQMVEVNAAALPRNGRAQAAAPPPPAMAALEEARDFAVIGQERGNEALDIEVKKDLFDVELVLPANQGLRAFADARKERAAPVQSVREYAHTPRSGGESVRSDFTETVYWHAGVKTNPSTGVATITFNLSDSVTAFRVLADAFDGAGNLGAATSQIESVKPFSIEPKIPLQLTSGDRVLLPVSLINGMRRGLSDGRFSAMGDTFGLTLSTPGAAFSLGPKERSRQLLQVDVDSRFSGLVKLALDAKAGAYRDAVTRTLDVQPRGFPRELAAGGVVEANGAQSFEFTLPEDMLPGSLTTSVTVYPTPLASMTDALQSLLQQPYGCFEQTSSTSYPMVMAQQYFLSHAGVDPALVEKARGLLETSYKQLVGFESPQKGYEWFGGDPGHEALTAYGLMQFTDMAAVRGVDKAMLDRTRAWLLSRREGNGGFKRSEKALDSFGGAPADTTNAYIVWALLESGQTGLDKEIAALRTLGATTDDSYIVALAANALHIAGDSAGARRLMDKLVRKQETAGVVKGASTSITRSGGVGLDVETTSLAVLAWLRDPAYVASVERGVKWIAESNKSGRFGSTQSTVLALRAIVAYDKANARPKAPGRLILTLDGKAVGAPFVFAADSKGAFVMPELPTLSAGRHVVTLRMEQGSRMPYAMSVRFHSLLPETSPRAQVGMQVTLRDPQVREGAVTEASVSIVNKSGDVLPSPVAIVGIPGGLEVRHDQLKELVKAGRIDAYEVLGREVVLYWRYIKAADKFDLPLSLVAAVPGTYTAPASRAYLYYTDEDKTWTPGLNVTITPISR